MESSYKTLTVNMSTLQQLITNFSHCYEMELQPWTNRNPPDLSGFGPLCKRVNTHVQHTNKVPEHSIVVYVKRSVRGGGGDELLVGIVPVPFPCMKPCCCRRGWGWLPHTRHMDASRSL